MKIYTEIVWSWDNEKGQLVKESSKSYDYEGPLTLCNDSSVESAIAAQAYGASDMYRYPKNTNPGLPNYIRFIAKRSYTSTQSTRGTPNGEVVLYMPPDALKTSYTQSIGDVEMGGFIALSQADMAGAGAQLAAGDLTGAMAAAGTIKGRVAGADKIQVLADMGKAGVSELAKKFTGTGTAQAVQRATGQILNPHKAVVYQGPGGFRTFSYTFVLVPKSADEAREIFNIVRFFKKRMHPGTGTGKGINNLSSVTLTYPDEFEIKYYVNNKEVDGSDFTKPLFKIKNCFMESFSTDYSTSNLVSFMDDGNPLTTTIAMSFKETELLTKQDIDAGY